MLSNHGSPCACHPIMAAKAPAGTSSPCCFPTARPMTLLTRRAVTGRLDLRAHRDRAHGAHAASHARHRAGPGITPPPPCGTTRMPRAWSRGDGTGVQARQARHEKPCGYQGRHESHAPITPALARSGVYGGCTSLWMNCANTQDGDAMPGDVPGAALSARRPITSANAGGLMRCGKIRKAAATVAAPDSYPHVTCGWGSQASADVRPAAAGDGSFTLAGSANLPGSRTGRGRACSGTGPGRTDGASRGQNRAHTTFPVSLRVVQPHLSLSAQMMCSPRPVWSREPGVRGAGAAVPGSATAHSTQSPGCSRPSRIGRPGPVPPGPGRACRSALVSSSDTTIAMSGLRSAMPPGARWRR